MFYVSNTEEELEAYNAKVVEAEGYDGVLTVRWAEVVEHHEGGQWAIIKHDNYALVDGVDESGNPLDPETVGSISEFYPPLEVVSETP